MIGLFDSGVGGLSVLREVRTLLPDADLVYLADQARSPYGGRTLDEVRDAAERCATHLIDARGHHRGRGLQHRVCRSVVETLRAAHPGIVFVGMEPAVKPAAAATRSRVVGVLATPTTFEAEVFDDLVGRFASGIEVLAHPCPGWADLVERDGSRRRSRGDRPACAPGRRGGCRHPGAGLHPLRLHRRPDRRGGRTRRHPDRSCRRGRPTGGTGLRPVGFGFDDLPHHRRSGPLRHPDPFRCWASPQRPSAPGPDTTYARCMTEPQIPEEIVEHYTSVQDEDARLREGPDGTMEAIRTLELLGRHLPPPPARILDAGGGPGFYARRLTADGYEVHLIDPVPRHIETASLPRDGLAAPASACLGDARSLDHPDDSFDAVLLLGPLYHLTSRDDRMAALGEARRVVKPGWTGRRGSHHPLRSRTRWTRPGPDRRPGLRGDPAPGPRRRPAPQPHRHGHYFTTAFFHHPDELRAEMTGAGFEDVEVFAVEGISWAASDLAERLAEPPPARTGPRDRPPHRDRTVPAGRQSPPAGLRAGVARHQGSCVPPLAPAYPAGPISPVPGESETRPTFPTERSPPLAGEMSPEVTEGDGEHSGGTSARHSRTSAPLWLRPARPDPISPVPGESETRRTFPTERSPPLAGEMSPEVTEGDGNALVSASHASLPNPRSPSGSGLPGRTHLPVPGESGSRASGRTHPFLRPLWDTYL